MFHWVFLLKLLCRFSLTRTKEYYAKIFFLFRSPSIICCLLSLRYPLMRLMGIHWSLISDPPSSVHVYTRDCKTCKLNNLTVHFCFLRWRNFLYYWPPYEYHRFTRLDFYATYSHGRHLQMDWYNKFINVLGSNWSILSIRQNLPVMVSDTNRLFFSPFICIYFTTVTKFFKIQLDY